MTLAPRRWAFVAIFWMALFIVLTHALAPTGSPLLQNSGSAFNPFTSEVALDPKRVGIVEKARSLQPSDDGAPGQRLRIEAALAPATPVFLLARPAGGAALRQAPPQRSSLPLTYAFQARAPPSA